MTLIVPYKKFIFRVVRTSARSDDTDGVRAVKQLYDFDTSVELSKEADQERICDKNSEAPAGSKSEKTVVLVETAVLDGFHLIA